MLPNVTAEISTAMVAKGAPYPVVYGPLRTAPGVNSPSQIVVQRDRQRGDTVETAPSHRHNPRLVFKRAIGGLVHIFAHSRAPGASVGDHERVADKLVDQLLVAILKVSQARIQPFRVTESRLMSAQELEEQALTTWPGVVYLMRFQIDRGVTDADWSGEGAGEATFGDGGAGIGTTIDTSSGPAAQTDLPSATTRID